ncbi:MAG: hypothetical protein OXC62_12980 [Aestuariivita sp.]|nr:hypothetical protein [Aestuariivita sp.]
MIMQDPYWLYFAWIIAMGIGALPGLLAGWHLSKIRQPIARWILYIAVGFVLYGIVLILGTFMQIEIFEFDQASNGLNWGQNAGIGCVTAMVFAARKGTKHRKNT